MNDTYGHAVGDELLKAVAVRLGRVLRRNDTVARLGGDEFVVVLAEISRPEDAAAVASKIVLSIHEPFSIAGHTLTIGTSIGIALSPKDARMNECCSNTRMRHVQRKKRRSWYILFL